MLVPTVLTALMIAVPVATAKEGNNGNGNGNADHGNAAQSQGNHGNGNGNGNGNGATAAPAPATAPAASKPDKPAASKPHKPAASKPHKPAASKPASSKPASSNGSTQGNSPSDPDGLSNGGVDKPGGTGSISDDRDGNNGCGNDDDREDDNNGNCGGHKVKTPTKAPHPTPVGGGDTGSGAPGTPGGGNGSTGGGDCTTITRVAATLFSLFGFDAPRFVRTCTTDDAAPTQVKGHQPVTLCHATGSATNPFVVITIDSNGLHGHGKHAGDIIPAPAGGCPAATVTTPSPADGQVPDHGKVTICHATGSATNPFVEITISVNGLNGHGKHEGDLIPVPAGGCPVATTGTIGTTPVIPTPVDTTPPTTGTPPTAVTPTDTTTPVAAPGAAADTPVTAAGAGATDTPAAAGDEQPTATAGAEAADTDATPDVTAAAVEVAPAAAAEESDQLPFTGLALGTIVLIALIALAIGWGSKRHGHRAQRREDAR